MGFELELGLGLRVRFGFGYGHFGDFGFQGIKLKF